MSDNTCLDACNDICLQGSVSRGTFRTVLEACNDTRPIEQFSFRLTVKNCTGKSLSNARFILDLRDAFLLNGGAVCSPNSATSKFTIDAALGQPDGSYDGVQRRSLLCHGATLPPGCTTFLVTLQDRELQRAVLLQPVTFTVQGQIKCTPCETDNCGKSLVSQCTPVHKSINLQSDCLPLYQEDENNGKVIYVVPAAPSPEPTEVEGDGRSWVTAYRGTIGLNQAIEEAGNSAQVWVKQGTFSVSNTVELPANGVHLYGRFSGSETALCQRRIPRVVSTAPSSATQGLTIIDELDDLGTVILISGNNVVFDGFRVQRDDDGSTGQGILATGENYTVRHVEV